MRVRFDDSLDVLVAALRDAAVPVDTETTVIRDGLGKLLVARREVPEALRAEQVIRAALGAYAAPITLVTGEMADTLLGDPTIRTVLVNGCRLRYGDRRVVGADWLAGPGEPPSDSPPRLVFGSIKGGVGRSTALAVLAADLARDGKRVLVVDLDLEAPGVGFMLLPRGDDEASDQRPEFGAIDYLVENGLGGIADEELFDFIGISSFGEGSIEVLPAVGRKTDLHPANMLGKLSRALTEDVDASGRTSVIVQVREMIDRFSRYRTYDAVLVDARAGLAESTASALLGLGGDTLLFGVDQPQTFCAYRYLFAHLSAYLEPDAGDWRRRIAFVQAKAPAVESKRNIFRDKLYELCADFLYDAETLAEDGSVALPDFHPGPNERGPGVPHDAAYIRYDPTYDAFDPIGDHSQLDEEVYRGPFGDFLARARDLLSPGLPQSNK